MLLYNVEGFYSLSEYTRSGMRRLHEATAASHFRCTPSKSINTSVSFSTKINFHRRLAFFENTCRLWMECGRRLQFFIQSIYCKNQQTKCQLCLCRYGLYSCSISFFWELKWLCPLLVCLHHDIGHGNAIRQTAYRNKKKASAESGYYWEWNMIKKMQRLL